MRPSGGQGPLQRRVFVVQCGVLAKELGKEAKAAQRELAGTRGD